MRLESDEDGLSYEGNSTDAPTSKLYIPSARQVRKRVEKDAKMADKKKKKPVLNNEMVILPSEENGTAIRGYADPEVASVTSDDDEEDEVVPQMSLWMSLVLLAVISAVSHTGQG